MDTKSLTYFMSKDEHIPRYFRGVMPRDYLPERLKPSSLYVINSEDSHSIGKHWILLSTMSSCYSAYICSLGQKPIYKHVIDSLRTLIKKLYTMISKIRVIFPP